MHRLLALALIVAFLGETPVMAHGPLTESGKRAAQQIAQSQPQSSRKRALLWTGGALAAGGVALMVLAKTALHEEGCEDLGGVVVGRYCYERDHYTAGITGVVAVLAGTSVMVVGALSNVQVGPNRIAYRVRF